MKNIVFFDLETKRSAGQVGGWHNAGDMGISIAVTYSTATDEYSIYTEEDTPALIDELRRADLVVGFNHVGFDYKVLQSFTMWDMAESTVNLDLLIDLENRIEKRISLDSVASASLGATKIAEGLQAIQWWNEYVKTKDIEPLMNIARYCCFDVKVTRDVFFYGAEHGHIKYVDKKTRETLSIPVDWAQYR